MRNNYFFSKKVPVNVDNEFSLNGIKFTVPEDNDDYRVISKYSESDEYTNESKMDQVNVVLGSDFKFYFYDEDGEIIKGVKFQK